MKPNEQIHHISDDVGQKVDAKITVECTIDGKHYKEEIRVERATILFVQENQDPDFIGMVKMGKGSQEDDANLLQNAWLNLLQKVNPIVAKHIHTELFEKGKQLIVANMTKGLNIDELLAAILGGKHNETEE